MSRSASARSTSFSISPATSCARPRASALRRSSPATCPIACCSAPTRLCTRSRRAVATALSSLRRRCRPRADRGATEDVCGCRPRHAPRPERALAWPEAPMRHHAPPMAPVEIRGLSKRFRTVLAVDDLSFDIEAGRVTGFLGPNGAGKSTTLRALLGLVHPTAGTATFDGRRYDELDRPSATVGAVLEDASFHPGRTGRNHLRVLAAAGGHPRGRVDDVLTLVALAD